MNNRLIVITAESAWLVERSLFDEAPGVAYNVVGRASFGSHMPTDHNYEGIVLSGPDGPRVEVGGRLVFRCICGQRHDGWPGGDGTVTSGRIVRIVNAVDHAPKADVPGTITLDPSWSFLMPFIDGNFEVRHQARKAFDLADLLVTLVDMGRVTQADLQAARSRRAEA